MPCESPRHIRDNDAGPWQPPGHACDVGQVRGEIMEREPRHGGRGHDGANDGKEARAREETLQPGHGVESIEAWRETARRDHAARLQRVSYAARDGNDGECREHERDDRRRELLGIEGVLPAVTPRLTCSIAARKSAPARSASARNAEGTIATAATNATA